MANLLALKASILKDGKIDAAEVAEIKRAIYEDGRIDQDEANFLFELNDQCSGAANDDSWATLFVDAICAYLLEDVASPGEVDSAATGGVPGECTARNFVLRPQPVPATRRWLLRRRTQASFEVPAVLFK